MSLFNIVASNNASGARGKGWSIPQGSLDKWKAARDGSGTALCEVVGMGDSLTRGEGPTGGLYSFLKRLRERSVAAGFADGGRGWNETVFGETLDNYSGEVAPVSASTGFASLAPWGIGAISSTGGESRTFKVKASRARLWWSRYQQAGRWSYTVNGGAAVTVNGGYLDATPRGAGASITAQNPELILLGASDGMLGGGATNTIVVTNLGGNIVLPTVINTPNVGSSGSGNVPAGTYDYVITRVAGGGETIASNVVTVTVGSGGRIVEHFLSAPAGAPYGGTFNIYRRTTGTGNYQLAAQVVNSNGNSNDIGADNSATTTAQQPPTVSTAGLDPTFSNVSVQIEAINDTGIVWHNQGSSGTSIGSFFDVDDILFNSNVSLALLGIQWGLGTNGIPLSTSADYLPSAVDSGVSAPLNPATARKPALVFLAFGTNDLRLDWNYDVPPAPSAVAGTTGTVPAATYYYKAKRHLANGQLGPASVASAGVTVDGSKQIVVTLPVSPQGPGVPPLFSVYRATSAGGTYSLVGQGHGFGGLFVDNVTNLGPTMPADSQFLNGGGHEVLTDQTVMNFGRAIQIIRNAGADPLVCLPNMALLAGDSAARGATTMLKLAIQKVAEMHSVAWVDFDVAVGKASMRGANGYTSFPTNPHIPKAAYQVYGDFIWDNVLSK